MIKTLTLTDQQAKGLADRLRVQDAAIAAAGHYLSALCDQDGLGAASLVSLDGLTLTVSVADDGPTP